MIVYTLMLIFIGSNSLTSQLINFEKESECVEAKAEINKRFLSDARIYGCYRTVLK